jgi:hypothetical protein
VRPKDPVPIIGWREWVALPELGVERIKVKVDTGAHSSALHAFNLEEFELDGESWVRFDLHPLQRDSQTTVAAEAPLVGRRWVKSSSGVPTLRPVIRTKIKLGRKAWRTEVTLVRRDVMGFRMLLGRRTVRRRFLVDCGRSFLVSESQTSGTGNEARPRQNGATKETSALAEAPSSS